MIDGLVTQTDRYYYMERAKTELQAHGKHLSQEPGVTNWFLGGGYDKSSGSTAGTLSSAVQGDSWLSNVMNGQNHERTPERTEQNDRRRARVTVRKGGTVTVPEQLLEEIDEPEFVAQSEGGE